MYSYAGSLPTTGEEKIRAFVRAGGGYLGICGGAYFAAGRVEWCGFKLPMESLGLFSGAARGPIGRLGLFPGMCGLRRVPAEHPLSATVPQHCRAA